MAWYPTEETILFNGRVLPPGATTVLNSELPMDGCGWDRIRLHLSATVAAVATPFADGLFRFIKGITLRTSRGEVLLNNVPGMALYRLNQLFYRTDPFHDPVIAAGAVVTACLDIPLGFPFLNRPEDTYLNTGRYSNIELQITTGGLAVFAPAAPATGPVTFGISVVRTVAPLAKDGKSGAYMTPYITSYQNIATGTQLQWDLESSVDLGLLGFVVYNHDILLIEGAVPWCAPAAGGLDHIATITFQDSVRTWINALPLLAFQKKRRDMNPNTWYDGGALPVVATEIPTTSIGLYPHMFCTHGSVNEVYPTGRLSLQRLSFTLNAAAGTERADLMTFGYRGLR